MPRPLAPMANPYLQAWERHRRDRGAPGRDELLFDFGFAVPDEAGLESIARNSPNGVVEIGAGLGYWARLLAERGLDVVAYDLVPPPSTRSQWFAGVEPWFPVAVGDETVAREHPDRTLLLVWPTRNEVWAADAATTHAAAGGQRLVYVGEPPGGRTGDARLHASLGLVGQCLACAFGVLDAPCVCDVTPRWEKLEESRLPSWDAGDDRLYVFGPAGLQRGRRTGRPATGRSRRRPRRVG